MSPAYLTALAVNKRHRRLYQGYCARFLTDSSSSCKDEPASKPAAAAAAATAAASSGQAAGAATAAAPSGRAASAATAAAPSGRAAGAAAAAAADDDDTRPPVPIAAAAAAAAAASGTRALGAPPASQGNGFGSADSGLPALECGAPSAERAYGATDTDWLAAAVKKRTASSIGTSSSHQYCPLSQAVQKACSYNTRRLGGSTSSAHPNSAQNYGQAAFQVS